MEINVDIIQVNKRKRQLDAAKVAMLAGSINEIGLLNPITVKAVNSHYELVAGYHRLEAFRVLQRATIPAQVFDGDDLTAELAEIDENLRRNDLTTLEQGEHLKRRNEIVEALDQRAKQGAPEGNNNAAKNKGDNMTPLFGEPKEPEAPKKTTAEVAAEAGISERSAQRRLQVVKDLLPEVIEMIRGNDLSDNLTQLLELSRLPGDEQKQIAQMIVTGKAKSVSKAKKAIELEAKKAAYAEQTRQEAERAPIVEVADCLDWLADKEPCDLLLTDPPYSTDIEDIEGFSQWLPVALQKVKDTGRAYVFIGSYPREVAAYLNLTIPEHMRLEQMLVWTYKNTIGQNPSHVYKKNYQICLYYVGVNAPPLDCPMTSEQWAVISENAPDGRQGDRFHPWQKPMGIAEMFVRHSTAVGGVVYDPFACTGTFLLAGAKLGRKGYGCDISKENLDIAIERGCRFA